ncbi:hypothetical protein [Neobacillus sp. FSL H8-0543]|uniref:hypothetical protein n=1 Tax=Neobacillus sp. FSL H8-0543 TaxID=2954672 RepID=UPI0031593F44
MEMVYQETRNASDESDKFEFELTGARYEEPAAKNSWWIFLIQIMGEASSINR